MPCVPAQTHSPQHCLCPLAPPAPLSSLSPLRSVTPLSGQLSTLSTQPFFCGSFFKPRQRWRGYLWPLILHWVALKDLYFVSICFWLISPSGIYIQFYLVHSPCVIVAWIILSSFFIEMCKTNLTVYSTS